MNGDNEFDPYNVNQFDPYDTSQPLGAKVDKKINPETGQAYTFFEKLSNIFEPVIPQ